MAVVPKRLDRVRVPDHLAQRRAIAFQAPLALNKILIHPDHHWKIHQSELLTDLRSERFYFLHLSIFCDLVGLGAMIDADILHRWDSDTAPQFGDFNPDVRQ